MTYKKLSKSQLIKLRGNKCEICSISEWQGKPITFDEHHCDRNRENIVESNRLIICPNCHRQQHLKKSEETRNKQKIAKAGKNHPMFGRHHKEESRRKTSESMKKSWTERKNEQ